MATITRKKRKKTAPDVNSIHGTITENGVNRPYTEAEKQAAVQREVERLASEERIMRFLEQELGRDLSDSHVTILIKGKDYECERRMWGDDYEEEVELLPSA